MEQALLTRHIEATLVSPLTDDDPAASSRRLLLCDAVACMDRSDSMHVPASLVDTARKLLEQAGTQSLAFLDLAYRAYRPQYKSVLCAVRNSCWMVHYISVSQWAPL